MIRTFIARSCDRDTGYWAPAAEAERIEKARYALLQEARR
ncbi:hypothetical protein GGR38_004122 [Novosphingobium sediminicola]|uniref:Uncharacterized protein n=1 Tax=Novosphingobium sediminicola TaxID=563162 RepID=A0A7W6G873_9SPHN|nr:hypothetical protein [Novosphingobium sediminicola]